VFTRREQCGQAPVFTVDVFDTREHGSGQVIGFNVA